MAKKPKIEGQWVGGCAAHEVRGPVRDDPKKAAKDAHEHGERMHGSADYRGGYIERRK